MKQFYKRFEVYILFVTLYLWNVYRLKSFLDAAVISLCWIFSLFLCLLSLAGGDAIILFGNKSNGWNIDFIRENKAIFLTGIIGGLSVLSVTYFFYVGLQKLIISTAAFPSALILCLFIIISVVVEIVRLVRKKLEVVSYQAGRN